MTYYLNFMGFNVPYYMGIDSFLKEYKNAVYSCLTNLKEGE